MDCPVCFGYCEVDCALVQLGPLLVIKAHVVAIKIAEVLRRHCSRSGYVSTSGRYHKLTEVAHLRFRAYTGCISICYRPQPMYTTDLYSLYTGHSVRALFRPNRPAARAPLVDPILRRVGRWRIRGSHTRMPGEMCLACSRSIHERIWEMNCLSSSRLSVKRG